MQVNILPMKKEEEKKEDTHVYTCKCISCFTLLRFDLYAEKEVKGVY